MRARVAPPSSALHISATRRGVLVVGDGATNVRRYVAAAGMAGWPVLSEPNGGGRYGDTAISTYHFLLGTPGFAEAHQPDVVVTLGRPGLSRPLLAWLKRAQEHVVVARDLTRWPDPTRSATQVAQAVEIPVAAGGDQWLNAWRRAEMAARHAVDDVLDAGGLSEPRLARDLAALIPNGSLLFCGSSMPIRDLDQAMRPRRGVRLMANRGASGIDGLVSTAAGAALAHHGRAYRAAGRPVLPPRPERPGHRAPGAPARPVRRGGQQRRRRDLLAAAAVVARRLVRADLRHAPRRRPGLSRARRRAPPTAW